MHFFEKYNIQMDDWLPYSPDLNSIKHIWVKLKCRQHRKESDIGFTNEGPENMNARLAEVLPKIWVEILEPYIEKL